MIKYDLIIIDGNNLASVSHFAYPNLSADTGKEIVRTGLIFGFIEKLLALKTDVLADGGRILITWDLGYGKRKELYPEYKGNRVIKKNQDEYRTLSAQMEMMKKLLKITIFNSIYIPNQEGDDVIASLVRVNTYTKRHKQYNKYKVRKILIVSGDNDLNQLITNNVHQMQIGFQKRILHPDNFEDVRKQKINEVVLLKMLEGDSSDNIKGLERVGKITARKLLDGFSTNEKELLLKGKIIIPAALAEWVAKKKKNPEEVKAILELNWKLIKLNGYMKGLFVVKGKPDEDKLYDELDKLEMQEFLKPRNFRRLV